MSGKLSSKEIDVVVLAGGFGTRLREVIGEKQKVVAEINKKPFLEYLIAFLYSQGFRRIILALGYKANDVISTIQLITDLPQDLEIIYSIEPKPLGTGGAIKHALQYVCSKVVCIQNGDTFCKVCFQDVVDAHIKSSADATIVVSKLSNRKDVGMIELDQNQNIVKFNEKKPLTGVCYQSNGIYVMNTSQIKLISDERKISIEEDIFAKNKITNLKGYICNSQAYDIGTRNRYENINLVGVF